MLRDFIGKPFRFGEFGTLVKRVLASELLPGRALSFQRSARSQAGRDNRRAPAAKMSSSARYFSVFEAVSIKERRAR
jgi:hypothetical protein